MANGEAQFQHGIDPARIAEFRDREAERYRKARPRTEREIGHGAPAISAACRCTGCSIGRCRSRSSSTGPGARRIIDIDGNTLDDFCLGDTGSMFGHSPKPVARAIRRQAERGLTYMLPTEDARGRRPAAAERFGLPFWQIATTATDANRFALRVARAVTGRPKILVFNGCYHGSVDETFVRLKDGRPINRPGLAGEFRDHTQTDAVVEFNDIAGARAGARRMATSPASSPSRC